MMARATPAARSLRCFIRKPWYAGRLQAKQLHRPAARRYFEAGDTCVLVAVLHIRLIRPGRPGIFV
jgi:hypothetical protein